MNPVYDGLVANDNGLDGIELDTGGYYADATLKVPGSTPQAAYALYRA